MLAYMWGVKQRAGSRSRRRKKWKAPNNPTAPARQLWAACFPGEPWPSGWRVQWAGFMRGAAGMCIYRERRILLSYGDMRREPDGAVRTLLHEFVHLRCGPSLRHGKEFRSLEANFAARLAMAPRVP